MKPLPDVKCNMICVLVLPGDNLARGFITSVKGDEVNVQLLDFGVKACVRTSDCKLLPKEYLDIPAQVCAEKSVPSFISTCTS